MCFCGPGMRVGEAWAGRQEWRTAWVIGEAWQPAPPRPADPPTRRRACAARALSRLAREGLSYRAVSPFLFSYLRASAFVLPPFRSPNAPKRVSFLSIRRFRLPSSTHPLSLLAMAVQPRSLVQLTLGENDSERARESEWSSLCAPPPSFCSSSSRGRRAERVRRRARP
jgi:hypothetical protein